MGPRVSRPRLEYWGVLDPCWRHEGLRGFHIIYLIFPFDFVRVGLMYLFPSDIASRGALDAMARIEMCQSREPKSARSRTNVCGKY